MATTWDVAQAQRIGAAIKTLRGDRSAQWLAERTAEIGLPISRSTIADLENRRRRYVSTAELCVLAWALRVPPIRLLFPDLPDGLVEVVPGEEYPSIVAATWFSGETLFLPEFEPKTQEADEAQWLHDVQAAREISDGARLVQLSRERIAQQSRIGSLTKLAARLRDSGDAEGNSAAESLVSDIVVAEKLLEQINAALRGRPSTYPPVADAVVADDGG
ncbi:hypothetical protein [Mycolicibacterium sp. HS_4_1]